ncbi:NAD-dependent epimerase/dehydratase family protein [Brevibacillus choshinensis]|uniref:NAD-dependent epimerase/dehydratase family protein n=1 Tax=Brevibacillus choshinensis TaxID=54911 RepID=UPI002E1AA971|nr:NAD-dependent epimerase/dehydratase family protein [Brevibacillus choshinensis]MED4583530.1 NAD-dependent epimerase/dehydratase family protein [Brevibacillus choshinensis]
MRAFVTGGTGLLGSNLVRLLVEEKWQIKVLVRSAEKAEKMIGGLNVEVVKGDMMNVDLWAHHMKDCDVLFHTAAYFRETFRKGNHWTNLEKVNVINTIRLFELAEKHGVGKIVHTSTNATIRKRHDGEISDESDQMNPDEALNLYEKSKVIGDQEIQKFARKHLIPIVTVLPAWMFGPGDAAPTGSGQFVLNFLSRKLPGSFHSGIDVVDARDVACAMIQAAKSAVGGERYILSAYHTGLDELFRILQKVSGIQGPSKSFPISMVYLSTWFQEKIAVWRNRETDMSVDELRVMTELKRTSGEKAIRDLHITYRPLEDTMRDTVEWYRLNGMGK